MCECGKFFCAMDMDPERHDCVLAGTRTSRSPADEAQDEVYRPSRDDEVAQAVIIMETWDIIRDAMDV